MRDGKIVVAWLFQKYEGGSFYAAGVIAGLNSPKFSTMCVYLEKRSDAPNLLEKDACETAYLSTNGATKLFNPILVWKITKFLKENKVDVLHCHRHKAAFYGTLAAQIAKSPVVLLHVHALSRTRNLGRKILNFFIFKKAHKIIGCAQSVREDVVRSNWVCPEKVIALENSIDFDKFANVNITKSEAKVRLIGVPADAFVYGMIARFGPYKGHSVLIRAFKKVKAQLPLSHLVLIGGGEMKDQIEKQVLDVGLDSSVHFLGKRSDIPELLRGIDVCVLPSIGSEGMPIALLEAMSAQVPCIATAFSGIPEIINSEDVGFLVPPQNVNALSEMMIRIAGYTDQQREKIGNNAQQRIASRFSHSTFIKKLQDLYETELGLAMPNPQKV